MRRVLLSLGFALLIACGAQTAAPGQPQSSIATGSVPTALIPTPAVTATTRLSANIPTTSVAPTVAPTVAPSVAPTLRPTLTPTVNLCGAPANPWNYNFCGGSFITSSPSAFCSYFNCIATFSSGRGYVVQCSDGTFSRSGGISGSCSGHGGNARALYSP
jgi:hypothetical protein